MKSVYSHMELFIYNGYKKKKFYKIFGLCYKIWYSYVDT